MSNYQFKLIKNTWKEVTIKNIAKTSYAISNFPYISPDINYITITKGNIHTLTITKDNNITKSFTWAKRNNTIMNITLQ